MSTKAPDVSSPRALGDREILVLSAIAKAESGISVAALSRKLASKFKRRPNPRACVIGHVGQLKLARFITCDAGRCQATFNGLAALGQASALPANPKANAKRKVTYYIDVKLLKDLNRYLALQKLAGIKASASAVVEAALRQKILHKPEANQIGVYAADEIERRSTGKHR